ncbi:cytochrome b5 domain-containing protein [Rhodocytophaga aerolata]|uniref:Cytochrome b5 domain-containing protein n=1 Tax=Rhodocytophaga aerolata TaxID=455078 RepID=A0ABT8RJ80_9BACT|nr:cytochrome b5 domain-containing protein [Rhodocytophaga aerolata]MDO1451268.1 cytochrome b5 domain-containing protein [Rhodocytophaga aerolata]
MDTLKKITRQELACNNGLNGVAAWIGYKGYVYDVTPSPLFQHGKHYRLKVGEDLTPYMQESPHLEDVLEKFPVVGELVNE